MKKVWITKRALICLLLAGLFLGGCVTSMKPVNLSPEYRSKVVQSLAIIKELESRYADGSDPAVYKEAMGQARATLEVILDADNSGGGL